MKKNALVKILFLLSIVVSVSGCTEKPSDETKSYEQIVVGKTDYPGGNYIDYSPDMVLYAVTDLNDRAYQESRETYNFTIRTNNEIQLELYNQYNVDGYWTRYLVYYGNEHNICMTDTSNSYVQFFDKGDIVTLNNNWGRNTNAYHELAEYTFSFQDDSLLEDLNIDMVDKYLCFKYQINEAETFQWIHLSVYNLDSVVIHDAYSTYSPF